ncbi:MAG: hypothetical protein MI976_08450 [Pseudomonadales bacterium]|nr:hypothetical protein [Pseudomonadales bacterium]
MINIHPKLKLTSLVAMCVSATLAGCGSGSSSSNTEEETETTTVEEPQLDTSNLPSLDFELSDGSLSMTVVGNPAGSCNTQPSTPYLIDVEDLNGADGEFYLAGYEEHQLTQPINSFTNFYVEENSVLTVNDSLLSSDNEVIVIHSLGGCEILGTIDTKDFSGELRLLCESIHLGTEAAIRSTSLTIEGANEIALSEGSQVEVGDATQCNSGSAATNCSSSNSAIIVSGGDISINGSTLGDPSGDLSMSEELMSEGSTRIILERDGQQFTTEIDLTAI